MNVILKIIAILFKFVLKLFLIKEEEARFSFCASFLLLILMNDDFLFRQEAKAIVCDGVDDMLMFSVVWICSDITCFEGFTLRVVLIKTLQFSLSYHLLIKRMSKTNKIRI